MNVFFISLKEENRMDSYIIIAAPVVIFFVFFVPIFLLTKLVQKNWNKRHPDTLDEYLQKNPKAKTSTGIACGTCGSKSLRNLGYQNATDKRRLVSCNSCSANLYHAE